MTRARERRGPPWVRIDDVFTAHPKLLGLTFKQRWAWLEVLTYCARQQNDGVIPAGISDVFRSVTPAFLERCVLLGLIDREDGRMSVHDWQAFNPRDATAAERKRRQREREAAG